MKKKSRIEKLLRDCNNMDIQWQLNIFGDATDTVCLALSEFERLKNVVSTVRKMRSAQAAYFKNKLFGDLKESKQLEKDVDRLLSSLWDESLDTVTQEALL